MNLYIYTYIPIYTYTYIHICTHTHTYIQIYIHFQGVDVSSEGWIDHLCVPLGRSEPSSDPIESQGGYLCQGHIRLPPK